MLTNAPKGTKDMLPKDAYKWHYVEKAFEELCRRYGFREIRTPVFEHTELFVRGVGGTTDVVQKEMYTWEQAKRSLSLRPEGTSPVVRALVENKLYAEVQPTKVYYNISCFRYEKPQSGRLREFHQFGIETFGTDDMMADAEIIAMADEFLKMMGITDVKLRINSIGCPECRENYRKVLKEWLAPKYDQLCDTCKSRYETNPMRILDCKSPEDQKLVEGAPVMLDYLCDDCREAFEELKSDLEAMDIAYTVDPGIVRGLDYYTKTAFEFISENIGAQSTVCGGGRYDYLTEEIGGPHMPGVGFGLGIERLLITMEENGFVIPEPEGPDAFIAFMGDRAKKYVIKLVSELRKAGFSIEMDSLARNLKGQFKYADRVRARRTIVIGDDELDSGRATVKDMMSGEQQTVAFEDITALLK
ncbi:MAG: histidine--tRNA ligase [Eubacteriaceae bacterium]|nr:histidine--tRNA ligase [Eubacteriaceae bacterium]